VEIESNPAFAPEVRGPQGLLASSDRKTLVFPRCLEDRKVPRLLQKPGKRRLARSTQFSRNRIRGSHPGRRRSAGGSRSDLRAKTELTVCQFLDPSSTLFCRLPGRLRPLSGGKRRMEKNRKPFWGCAI
jgi:hypothetical protein